MVRVERSLLKPASVSCSIRFARCSFHMGIVQGKIVFYRHWSLPECVEVSDWGWLLSLCILELGDIPERWQRGGALFYRVELGLLISSGFQGIPT